jgi:hypothetical protein
VEKIKAKEFTDFGGNDFILGFSPKFSQNYFALQKRPF